MTLPKPTRVSPDGSEPVFGCLYDSGEQCKIAKSNIRTNANGRCVIKIPMSFQKNCRREVMSHRDDIRSWFNPKPSVEDLERYVSTPSTHEVDTDDDHVITGIRMVGILIDNGRIYPKYDMVLEEKKTSVPRIGNLVMSLGDNVEEIMDIEVDEAVGADTIVLKKPRDIGQYAYDDEDDEDVEDEDDDEDEDEDDDTTGGDDEEVTEAIRKIQDTIDIAREELARLARSRQK